MDMASAVYGVELQVVWQVKGSAVRGSEGQHEVWGFRL